MFEAFVKYLSDKATLTTTELNRIKELSFEKKFRKRQHLLQEGDVCKHIGFVVKGCTRTYKVSPDGNEHILKFCIENWWSFDEESFFSGIPTKWNIDMLEDTKLIMWTKENYDQFVSEIPAYKALCERLVRNSLRAKQERIYDSISQTSEERYHTFAQKYPEIANRVPLHMIASYLGLSRKTLNRIRSQYAHK